MNEIKNAQTQVHEVSVKGRKQMSINGVKDVISFDENQVELVTVCGEMTVEGRELHVSRLDLDLGVVELDGTVDRLYYPDEGSDNGAKRGILSRLFG